MTNLSLLHHATSLLVAVPLTGVTYAERDCPDHNCPDHAPQKSLEDYFDDYPFGADGDSDHPDGYDGWPGNGGRGGNGGSPGEGGNGGSGGKPVWKDKNGCNGNGD